MLNKTTKKYMKQGAASSNDYNLLKIFIFSFCVMLIVFTVLIKSFSPSVDVSIGDYKQDEMSEDIEKNVDGRLAMLQDEDREKNFTDIMKNADVNEKEKSVITEENVIEAEPPKPSVKAEQKKEQSVEPVKAPVQDIYYKVYIGSYTSSEQAKVAKDIIQESENSLNPIVKCIGSNNYTLQVGIFKNKASAESLLYTIQQSHLPGRIVQEH